MKFDELDKKMRVFETAHDLCVLPDIYMVARIDGRCFTRLTKEVHKFEAPFDIKFRDLMVETTKYLNEVGFNVLYSYTQSDEISLLIHPNDVTFNKKIRKLNSILASEASAKFSLLLGDIGSFDCRICQLPTKELVVDYFRWRNEDAHRNALSAHCYWLLRRQDKTARQATSILDKTTNADKNELLFKNGINFNDLPNWQKRGIGMYWEDYEKKAINKKTGEEVTCQKKRLKIHYELPMREDYSQFIIEILNEPF